MYKIILIGLMCFELAKPKYNYVPPADQYQTPHDFEPQLMHITWYLNPNGNKTANGKPTFLGSCASNREHLGDMVALYDKDKNFICYLEVNDTGSAKSLKNGTSIDIFVESEDQMWAWVNAYGEYMYVQFIESDG